MLFTGIKRRVFIFLFGTKSFCMPRDEAERVDQTEMSRSRRNESGEEVTFLSLLVLYSVCSR